MQCMTRFGARRSGGERQLGTATHPPWARVHMHALVGSRVGHSRPFWVVYLYNELSVHTLSPLEGAAQARDEAESGVNCDAESGRAKGTEEA